ncbi:MAG TPA: helix-turn-helix transcriptional regulator [Flavipsychrobacter sp.]|nr:helix-turn-helix transcriptional regulator [Flavipsychrobacter sp.]
MRKAKNTIPVVDICSLGSTNQVNSEVIAEPFAKYLEAHPNLHLPHRHSFYHLVLFTKGRGSHSIDFQQFEVIPREIYFMKPGQVHRWDFEGETDGYVINFSEHLFDHFLINGHYLEQFPFLQGIAEDNVVHLDAQTYDSVKIIFEKITEEMHYPGVQTSDLVRLLLLELFIIVNRRMAKNVAGVSQPTNSLLLYQFRKLVDIHYAEKRLPKAYAAMLYITPNHLNTLCKDLLGRSAGEIIRDRILLEAKRLLINAGISISEIASALDFTDNSHLTRFFKKHTNLTPDEFRKNASVTRKK